MSKHVCFTALVLLLRVTSVSNARLQAVGDVNPTSTAAGAAALLPSSSNGRRLADRQLQQSSFCPDGCDRSDPESCQPWATAGGLICVKCKNNLRPDPVTGLCTCSPGRYSDAANPDMCLDCPFNHTCPGGAYRYASPPPKIPCPAGTLTQVMRAGSVRACVNPPGYSYNFDANFNPFIEPCPANTYSRGYRKQRQCTPCPTGFTTDGAVLQTSSSACVVPGGYYLKAPGQVAACPRGEWKGGIGAGANCTRCPFAVTTRDIASTAALDCNMLLEGYYATRLDGGTGQVFEASACPQGFYCPGGKPGQSFDPRSVQARSISSSSVVITDGVTAQSSLSPSEPTIKACPDGMWTEAFGSVSVLQCMTPPGHYTAGGETKICSAGSFRADWALPGTATACTPCGEGVFAEKSDVVLRYDPVTYTVTEVPVTTSSEDCYIKPGQGLYVTSLTGSYRARNCMGNEYGQRNTTFGLSPTPCKNCPTDMVTSSDKVNYPNSASYYVTNGDTPLTGGFIDVAACVTKDGWGMSGRGSQPCPQGFYNQKDTYSDCSQCDYGTTTEGVGKGVTKADCGVAKGFGLVNGKILPCPIGSYNDRPYTRGLTQTCTPCPDGSTTSQAGGDALNSCNLCQAGRGSNGGDNCLATCGGPNNPTYGTGQRAFGSACVDCLVAQTGFSFSWGFENDVFAPKTVAPLGADSPKDCLAEFGQILDGAWWLPTRGNSATTVFSNVPTFDDCVARCSASTCQYITYDYTTSSCQVRAIQPLVYVGEPLIGFKGIASGDVGVNSLSVSESDTKASAVSSGLYTWYQEPNALDVGDQRPAPGAASMTTIQDCLNGCNTDNECAGVTIQLTRIVSERASTCQYIYGRKINGEFKRSMTRMDINRLAIPPLQ